MPTISGYRFSTRGLSFLTAVVMLGYSYSPAHAEPMPLTLNEAYQRVLVQSETLAVSEEAIRLAEARYWQALSSVLPEINLVFRHRIQSNRGGGGFSGDNDSGFNSGGGSGRHRFDGQLQVSQSIFSGFREYHALGAIRADRRAASAQLIRDRQTLFLDVSDLYYQILSQKEDLEVLMELDQALSKRVKELEERVDLGRSRTSELLASRTEYADNQAAIEQVRGLVAASRELMAFLLGRPADTFILLKDDATEDANKLADYLMRVGARPDIQAQEERTTSGTKRVSAARASFWPTIDFEFNWLALEDPERDEEWNMFFTAELPLFDGGLRAGELAEAKSNARVSQLNLERLRRLAEYDVRLAYSNFTTTASHLIRLREADRIATESLAAQEEDYKLGRTSNLDVLNALIRRQEVRRRFAVANFQTRANLNALHVAAGEVPATN